MSVASDINKYKDAIYRLSARITELENQLRDATETHVDADVLMSEKQMKERIAELKRVSEIAYKQGRSYFQNSGTFDEFWTEFQKGGDS